MGNGKYIVIKRGFGDTTVPILFTDIDVHAMIGTELHGEVISAGFFSFDENGKFQCFGESTSLKIKSRGDLDTDLLNIYFRMNS